MSIYQRCSQLTKINPSDNVEEYVSLTPFCKGNVTIPSALLSDESIDKWLCYSFYYISDIHLEHQITKEFPNGATDAKVNSFIKKLARSLFTEEFIRDIKRLYQPIIIFGGDTASLFGVAKVFYTEFINYWNKMNREHDKSGNRQKYIYAILGNHELWDFNTIEDCYDAYQSLFESLGISFMNNNINWCGKYRLPIKNVIHESQECQVDIIKDDDLVKYEHQMRNIHNLLIVGGIGFAGHNDEFNADNGIYRGTINRVREIEETKKWEDIYKRAVETAIENKSLLIVLTHNPLLDWKRDQQPDCGCIYFNGHNHRNNLYHDEDMNIHVFANNQLGYKKHNVLFKQAYIYKRMNPFAAFEDGYHEINSPNYLRFYDYIQENINGNGLVERQIKNNNAQFYMIKHSGYYGFFLLSPKGSYICAGGRIKKINSINDIEQIDINFTNMVSRYLRALYPYRNVQEQIAEAVKSFGGNGKIHGCIIDIDFYNHIMLNPNDGTMTYYTSPIFGQIKTYGSMLELLSDNNKFLEREYRKQLDLLGESSNYVLFKNQIDVTETLVQVDIKNSAYTISNRVNQLQRLFDKKILRDWNDVLLVHTDQKGINRLE
jgi:hypothetical protein